MINKIILTLYFSVIFCAGCEEIFHTPSDMRGKEMGLRSIEYQDTLSFSAKYRKIAIDHKARVSSQRYEVRIYFSSFATSATSTLWERKQELSRVLEGTEATFVDLSSNKTLESIILGPTTGLSINDSPGKPSSIWLFSKLKLNRGKRYRLELKIPPRREYPSEFYNTILVIGIGSTPLL